uniref:Uncharacterized protein n=1 Tax=Arsenophonus nasoniae TaxID=638 RepID=D2U3K7_9GAMM|nr:hypothetical protein ARN_32390 [Arsenophonus nasoniae]
MIIMVPFIDNKKFNKNFFIIFKSSPLSILNTKKPILIIYKQIPYYKLLFALWKFIMQAK